MEGNTKKTLQIIKPVFIITAICHILFCLYQLLFCLYNCSYTVNDIIWKTDRLSNFFETSTHMAAEVAPFWLLGMALTSVFVFLMIIRKNSKYIIPVCISFAAAVFIAAIFGSSYIYTNLPYDIIYWALSGWFAFEIIYIIWYFFNRF